MCQNHKVCICGETTMKKTCSKAAWSPGSEGVWGSIPAPVPPTVQRHACEVNQMPTAQVKLVFFGQCQRGLVR